MADDDLPIDDGSDDAADFTASLALGSIVP